MTLQNKKVFFFASKERERERESDELVTCPEVSYRVWFVVVPDLETS